MPIQLTDFTIDNGLIQVSIRGKNILETARRVTRRLKEKDVEVKGLHRKECVYISIKGSKPGVVMDLLRDDAEVEVMSPDNVVDIVVKVMTGKSIKVTPRGRQILRREIADRFLVSQPHRTIAEIESTLKDWIDDEYVDTVRKSDAFTKNNKTTLCVEAARETAGTLGNKIMDFVRRP